jgi:diguanylate cyclase (GGDEF)-like protein/PAS domain S-box-containing protein
MKPFNKRKFGKQLLLGSVLAITAGAGIYLSLSSLITAAGERTGSEAGSLLPVSLVLTSFAVFIPAMSLATLASFALVRREAGIRRRADIKLSSFVNAAEGSPGLITIMTAQGRIEYVNRAVELTTGYERDQLVGKRHRRGLPWHSDSKLLRQMRQTVLSGNLFHVVAECRRKDGGHFMLEERVGPFRNSSGTVTRMILIGQDVSREKDLEDRLSYLSLHDDLLGLPNRLSLVKILERSAALAKSANSYLSVLIIDIDQFKHVNDLFGARAGDEVLKRVSDRIRRSIGQRDVLARIGSDEFCVVHFDDSLPVDAGGVAERIRSALSQNIDLDGKEMLVTATLGIALFPKDGEDAWTLLKNADLAVAKAKAQGRNSIQFYDEAITRKISEFFVLERRLFNALKNNEYLVHYQPYCNLSTRTLAGAEALIKWKNPDLGVVSPSRFIPSLEDTGMIIEVGRWVLETACGRIKEWERSNRVFPVSVNLSLAQFHHKHLVPMVSEAVRDFRLDPRRLTLEVTETVFIQDMDFAVLTLKRLKDIGVSISVDDFGTGYSSLSYIKKLPVDNLKIDISFVRDVASDQDAASIITAITSMARTLNLKTIAEGVETEDQRKILHLLRCDMGQGYLFSHAVPPEDLEKMLMNKADTTYPIT